MGFVATRKRAGFSQADVAEVLGVTDAAVSMWETGKTRPRASILIKLADLYGCSVDELLREEESASQRHNSVLAVQ